MIAIIITQGEWGIIGTVLAGIFVIVAGLISVKRTVKATQSIAQTIEVNTNTRLSEALTTIKELRDTVTRLVEALAVAQESPAMERKPVPVQVIEAEAEPKVYPPA